MKVQGLVSSSDRCTIIRETGRRADGIKPTGPGTSVLAVHRPGTYWYWSIMKAVLVVTAALLWISAAKVGASPVLCLTLRATWAACNVDGYPDI